MAKNRYAKPSSDRFRIWYAQRQRKKRAGDEPEPPAPFTPLSLPNTIYWHDFSDFSTMWQDSAKTTPVTATGQPVGYVVDKTGNGHDLHQPTAGNRPILRIVGGLYKLEYDGATSNRWLESVSTIDLTGTANVSPCVAVTKNANHTGIIAETSNNSGSNIGAWGQFTESNRYRMQNRGSAFGGGTDTALTDIIASPSTEVLIGLAPIDGLTKIRVNAVEYSASTNTKGTGNYGNYKLYLGRRAGSSLPLDGDIYQNFLTSDILTGTNLANAENFLAEKSGVTL